MKVIIRIALLYTLGTAAALLFLSEEQDPSTGDFLLHFLADKVASVLLIMATIYLHRRWFPAWHRSGISIPDKASGSPAPGSSAKPEPRPLAPTEYSYSLRSDFLPRPSRTK